MPRTILIDTDPGQDDAIAILLALAHPDQLEVAAITTVAGNVPLDLTTLNACKVRALAGRPDVPVHAGCSRPLILPLHTAEAVHGPTGLEGSDLPPPDRAAQPGHGVDVIIDTVMTRPPGSVTLCTLAPLTNVALAMVKEPRIIPRLAGVVTMGGAFFAGGNSTPTAEFNILVDPHAAHIVVNSGVDLTLMPLDATHQVLTTPPRRATLEAIGTEVARQALGMITFYDQYDMDKYGWPGGPLHDPCVIAWLLAPALFQAKSVAVDVEINSQTTLGMTVFDWWGVTGKRPNARVVHSVDAEGFYALLTQSLAKL